MRKLFGKIHLWLSIPVGIILSIICFSGVALVFEKEITQACKPHLYKVSVPEGNAAVLPPSQLIARIKEQTADSLKLTSLQYSGKADETATVTFKNAGRKSLSVNPYTGEVNGWIEGNTFFQTMRKLHRWLLNPPPQKGASSVGKMIVGISTLLMVVILVSGLVIWWPRTRKALNNRLKVSCCKGWRRFWYDSHVYPLPADHGTYRAHLVVWLVSLVCLRTFWRKHFEAGPNSRNFPPPKGKRCTYQERRKETNRLYGLGQGSSGSTDKIHRLHFTPHRREEDTSYPGTAITSYRYPEIQSEERRDYRNHNLCGSASRTETERLVLCLPHRKLGRYLYKGTLFSGSFYRRRTSTQRVLFMVEEETKSYKVSLAK